MTLTHDLKRLSPAEQAYLVLAVGYLAWLALDVLTPSQPRYVRRQYDPTERGHWLDHRDIERLQDGHAVSLGRWDGAELLLEGSVIVDVEREGE